MSFMSKTEKKREAYEMYELSMVRLESRAFAHLDNGKFDDALVDTNWGKIVYVGKLGEARREGMLTSRLYNSLKYKAIQRIEGLLDEIKISRKNMLRNDSHDAQSDTPILEVIV